MMVEHDMELAQREKRWWMLVMRFLWRVFRLAEMTPGSRIFVAGHSNFVGGAITRNLRAAAMTI